MNKLHLRRNLVVFVDGNATFAQPQKHASTWNKKHSFTVKRAGSVIVIKDGVVVKNLFNEK